LRLLWLSGPIDRGCVGQFPSPGKRLKTNPTRNTVNLKVPCYTRFSPQFQISPVPSDEACFPVSGSCEILFTVMVTLSFLFFMVIDFYTASLLECRPRDPARLVVTD
jgi:hypothetical protein